MSSILELEKELEEKKKHARKIQDIIKKLVKCSEACFSTEDTALIEWATTSGFTLEHASKEIPTSHGRYYEKYFYKIKIN